MTRLYLNITAGGVAIVALGYLLAPHTAIGSLIDIRYEQIDQVHILRGIMGLYSGMVCFWFLGASRPEYSRAAVLSAVFFMFGLALGRIFSMGFDGMPSPFLAGATLVELVSGGLGVAILRGAGSTSG